MTMGRFYQGKDSKGNTVYSIPPTEVDVLQLTANTHRRYEIPTGTQFIYVGSTADILVKFGDETVQAIKPTGDSLTGRGPMLNPAVVVIDSEEHTHLSVLCESDTTVYIHRWRG